MRASESLAGAHVRRTLFRLYIAPRASKLIVDARFPRKNQRLGVDAIQERLFGNDRLYAARGDRHLGTVGSPPGTALQPVGASAGTSGADERHPRASLLVPGTLPSERSVETAERALAMAGIDRSQVGALVHGSVCRDHLEPATACAVHHGLGLAAQRQLTTSRTPAWAFSTA